MSKTKSSLDPIKWYVVFCKSKVDMWLYNHVIDKEFGHVYAIRDLNEHQWLIVQPRVNIVDIEIKLKSQYPHVKMLTGPDVTILDASVYPQDRTIACLNFSTCTEVVKGLLGIRSFWTWTPKQLYKLLTR